MVLSNEQFKEVHKKDIERMRFLVAKGKQERLDAACEREEIKQQLKRDLKNCDTLYTLVNHVSQSGMPRDIRVFMIKNNKPLDISYKVAKVLKRRQGENTGVRVQGFNHLSAMGIVYDLSRCLFKDGYKINQQWL
jgi:hypothetical protein|tara:strand:- start:4812 stop:5216 length:405 start_codon:yes stop_codon:yes gene_type:complete